MIYSPKGFWSNGITIVSITYLTKKLWFFYKIMSKIHLPTRNANISNFYFRDFEANWGQYGLQSLKWGHTHSNIMSHWGLRPWGQKYLTLMWGQIGWKSLIVWARSGDARIVHQTWPKITISTNWPLALEVSEIILSASQPKYCQNSESVKFLKLSLLTKFELANLSRVIFYRKKIISFFLSKLWKRCLYH